MKTSAIVCAVLAGTFAFSSVASARDWRGAGGDHGRDQRLEQRQDRRADRRDDRRQDRTFRQHHRAGVQSQPPAYRQPIYIYSQPVYSQPAYRTHTPRFYRGGYLPHQYRSQIHYVNDWRAYQGLYAPPYGHQWVSVNGEILLIALATGLIVNALLR